MALAPDRDDDDVGSEAGDGRWWNGSRARTTGSHAAILAARTWSQPTQQSRPTSADQGQRAAGCRCGYVERGRTQYIPGRIPATLAHRIVAGMDVARWQGVGRAVLADALPAVAAGAVMALGSGPAAMDDVPPRRPLD